MKTTIEVDQHDVELLLTALCYFDGNEDGRYKEWFGKDCDKVNQSFYYLYDLLYYLKP